jgi:hypothetical protein
MNDIMYTDGSIVLVVPNHNHSEGFAIYLEVTHNRIHNCKHVWSEEEEVKQVVYKHVRDFDLKRVCTLCGLVEIKEILV